MKKAGMRITVETYTALLKGYAHSGMMHKGAALFEEMCQQANPNARSLNTLLRGCLWAASTFENNNVAGGVVTSEIAWKRAGKFNQDASSFDYYVTQLCQAMRLDDADKEINRLTQVMKIKITRGSKGDSYQGDDPSALESLSICLLAYARAKAMLGLNCARHAAQSALNAVDSAKRGVGCDASGATSNTAQGGKRSWRPDAGGQRTASNALYRGHRLAEVRKEATIILDFLKKRKHNAKSAAEVLCNLLITRLFYLSGGGSTALPTRTKKSELESSEGDRVLRELMTTKWISFGLKASFLAFVARDNPAFANLTVLTSQQCEEILKKLGLQNATAVDPDGYIPFSDLFTPGDIGAIKRPLDIELGSGFGDWAVHQARSKPERDFVAVELRADRVAQTFARVVLSDKPLTNLCCVGAECGSFLRSRVRKATVSTIFVNHPEPPTQTYGADDAMLAQISAGGDEPGHMLSSDILIAAVECLEPREGQLIIVTDNRMYARLICVSLVKALKSRPALMEPLSINGMRTIESFGPVSLLRATRRKCSPCDSSRHSWSELL
ncbi:methyltransferase [Fragilaria crotonensis]|nr:methyltransferase [Fragilaria crotonensis]